MATLKFICVILWTIGFLLEQYASDGAPCDEQCKEERRAKAKKLVDEINAKNAGWKAEYNERIALMDDEERKRLGGSLRPIADQNKTGRRVVTSDKKGDEPVVIKRVERQATSLPESFDAREGWSGCAPIINTVRQQGNCGDCWAVSTASAMTDRVCIFYLRKYGVPCKWDNGYCYMSDINVASCTYANIGKDGCNGGLEEMAWDWIMSNGVLSGSNNTMHIGCQPYPLTSGGVPCTATTCSASCTNSNYAPIRFNLTGYTVLYPGDGPHEQEMQRELYANGSIVASFELYDEIYYYKSGVYVHTGTTYQGGHAVRVIGWGSELVNGVNTPYWLAANSWGAGFGMEGLFKIRRGTNEVGFESWPTFGNPKINFKFA